MKFIFSVILFLFATFFAATLALNKFPPQPGKGRPCLFELILRRFHYGSSWFPFCTHFGRSYNPEQCTGLNSCWCVDARTGIARTFITHAIGQGNCFDLPTVCPENQIYSECAGCDARCEDKDVLQACTTACRQKCTCPDGLYLDGERCVRLEQCPPVCNKTLNEVYNSCAPPCDATCDEPGLLCSLQESCNERCACEEGQVRNEERVCVNALQCPLREPICNETLNEVYNSCAPPCDATCDEPGLLCSLQESCNERCACEEGQVRNEEGVCVFTADCPPPEPTVPLTLNCHTHLEVQDMPYRPLCDEVGNFETRQCDEENCFCVDRATGSILEGTGAAKDEFDHDCNFYGDCPAGMTFSSCASPCPSTCDNPAPKCVRRCALDCVCPEGQVRLSENDTECVPIDLCPVPHTCYYKRHGYPYLVRCDDAGDFEPLQCTDNDTCWCVDEYGEKISGTEADLELFAENATCELARGCDAELGLEWSFCASPCQGTCNNKEPDCDAADKCMKGCVCKEGYFLNEDTGNCVQEENCPRQRQASKCEADRLQLSSPDLQDAFIPNCDSNGDYNVVQCYGFLLQCWCVDKTTGNEIVNTRASQFNPTYSVDCDEIIAGAVSIPDPPSLAVNTANITDTVIQGLL